MTFAMARRIAAAGLALLLVTAILLVVSIESGRQILAHHYLLTQDFWPAIALIVFLLLAPEGGRLAMFRPGRLAVVAAAALLLGTWLGARLVMASHDLSRDEQMATFDAAILASGRLFQPFPLVWRDLWPAMNQLFILPIGDREAWVSAYLPVNAALRALAGILDPRLVGPVCAAIGALALWRIAVRLWPDSRQAQLVTLLLYLGSSQLWITAMTAYAMSAHLALNLVWLWLFLGDRPWRHVAAVGVGVLATGLHQPIFHPLFVLPFFVVLLAGRRWRLLFAYTAAYLVIGLFWLSWPLLLAAQAITAPPIEANLEGVSYVERFLHSASGLSLEGMGEMAANLVRFAVWQHPLLIPLALLGVATAWRRDPVVRALAIGIVLPPALLLAVLPDQGLGWGYRYLHGLIGSACLLGGYGWRALGERSPGRAMLAATAAALLVLLPLHAVIAHRSVAPFAATRAALLASGADIVLIDDRAAPFARDLVVNRADLSNRPLFLKASEVSPGQLPTLCRRGSVAFAGPEQLAAIAERFGTLPGRDQMGALRAAAAAAGCRSVTLR